ncbi:MAG: cupin domain-containing protein [Pirellulales bacterium]|nr:cupin domain-containing protein [Pirellulales bacterium]
MFRSHSHTSSGADSQQRAAAVWPRNRVSATVRLSPWALGAAVALVALACFATTGPATPQDAAPTEGTELDAETLATMIQHFGRVKKEQYPWGWIRWMMSSELDPEAKMTFGLVQINAGQRNPTHIHPNCEEQLYVLAGSCEHQIGKRVVTLRAGDLIRIPAGTPHRAWTSPDSSMRAVIVYSSGRREMNAVEQPDS